MIMVLGVYCFRNDLRLHDNPALQLAREECDQLLVYAFEDRLWRTKKPKRISAHRARFTLDSLKCLEKKIIKLGGALHFLHGNIESSIPHSWNRSVQLCVLYQMKMHGKKKKRKMNFSNG